MNLDSLIINTRVRSGWSAIDLGFVLAKQFMFRSFLLYLVLAVPVFFILFNLIESSYFYLALWWFKPLFERPILFLLSRELFGERTNFWSVLKNIKHWLFPGLGWILSIRRISPTRGMLAAITLLERPSMKSYGKRVSVLSLKYSNQAGWLTFVLLHIENFLWFALLALVAVFLPELVNIEQFFESNFNQSNIYINLSLVLIMALVAPFYVAAGFMLYICRRIDLEGWDIEICFRDWVVKKNNEMELEAPTNA